MEIEKLEQHLKNTSLSELKEEWKAVEEFANIGPIALDFVQHLSRLENDQADIKHE